ncbi:MAG: GNAT family N-acetyltransferase [Planctomycetota bacterium]
MKTVPVKTYYLEMHGRPERNVSAPPEGVEIVRVPRPEIAFYRLLYDKVGSDWNWVDRKRLSDDQLRAILHDERVELHVLYVDGQPAGFCDMDRRVEGQVQIEYFGLMPEFIGKGLGGYFLDRMVEHAWDYAPKRVWLHTCTNDHESALPVYRRAGFQVYDERVVRQAAP